MPLLRAEDDKRLRTTRSGRQVFPKLEFWRNEAIARDADTGAVIGTFQGTAEATAATSPPATGKAPAGRRPGRPRKTESSPRAGAGAAGGAGPSGASPPFSGAPGPGAARKRPRLGDGSPVGAGGADGDAPAGTEGGGEEWSEEQVLALQEAQVEVDPAAKNYWQRVAARVPGRSADECYEKLFEDHPTPPREARGAVARHYLGGDGEPGGRRRQKLTKAKARKKVRAARWQLKREAQALDEPGGGAAGGASGSEDGGEDGDGQDGADDFYQTVEAQAIADQYIDKFKRQQAQHSRVARGRERAESSRGARGGMDAALGAGPSDSLAAAIRNAIASVASRGGGVSSGEDGLDKDGEEEEEEEEEAAPQILFGEGA